jgi:hypothetical protein
MRKKLVLLIRSIARKPEFTLIILNVINSLLWDYLAWCTTGTSLRFLGWKDVGHLQVMCGKELEM